MADATRAPLGRETLLSLALLAGLACTRPEAAHRQRPVDRVELVQAVAGMTPAEEQALVAQVAEGLGLPAGAPGADPGPTRVLRLTLKGRPSPSAGRSLARTVLVSTGEGLLFGALCPAMVFQVWTTVRSAALASGLGAVAGLAYGPVWYRANQDQIRELGYLPWGFTADWEILDRRPGRPDGVAARSVAESAYRFSPATPVLDLRPHLRPLPPEARSDADIRQASLRAYGAALVQRFRPKP